MATKRVCDRCGAEINPTRSATYVNVRSAFHEESPDIELLLFVRDANQRMA